MPIDRKIHQAGFIGALAMAVSLLASSCSGIKPERNDFGTLMNRLKADLESDVAVPRQEPFELRSFRPYAGDEWIGNAVAYGCYRRGQSPGQKGPSASELREDLEIIAEYWRLIRVYGADADTRRILEVIDEHNLRIKVLQGIWLTTEEGDPAEKAANINSVLLGIELANLFPDIVVAVSVGNETQVDWSGHRMQTDRLIRYIRTVRANVSVPVATADDYLYWNKSDSRIVVAETDFVFTHIHPLWNGQTLDEATDWLDHTYREIESLHPDRMIVIGETGWATDLNSARTGPGEQGTLVKGKVGLDAQASFLLQVNQWIESNQVTTFLFEVFDEPWKGGGENSPPNEIEKNWGVYNEDRTPKKSFRDFLAQERKTSE